MSAVISSCEKYRYMLERIWGRDHSRLVLWIMLNPSTADGGTDDQTIRKCRKFTESWGYDGFRVVNLYAWRATDPDELWSAEDPTGPDNEKHILQWADDAALIVCAWGRPGPKEFRPKTIHELLTNKGHKLHYLRLNKDGNPGHPLYLPGALTPQEWS
jgi:hypothetical protein